MGTLESSLFISADPYYKNVRHKKKTRFIGIDGEGETQPDGTHLYTTLSSSTRERVFNPRGLSFDECLDFLLELKERNPDAIFAGFSFGYDTNMVLGSLPHIAVHRLWNTGMVSLHRNETRITIQWRPGKWFGISLRSRTQRRSIRVWDVFGFFQTSFVKTLRNWHIGTEAQVAQIEAMKRQRGNFAQVDNSAIIEYCYQECELLAELMEYLCDTFDRAGIHLSSYQGAGAAGAALLQKYHVKEYIRDLGPDFNASCLKAYFGGRTEIFRVGECGYVHNYDINSAYPTAAQALPTMDGHVRYASRYDPDARYALWHVQWHVESKTLSPFPFRQDGRIYYSRNGSGWYHAVEVRAALDVFPQQAQVIDGYIFEPSNHTQPFAFVPEVYAERLKLKQASDMANIPIKLALNSMYGKLAQGKGYDNKKPPYQSYFWAGAITAQCRATLLRAAAQHPDALIGLATDGVFTSAPLSLPEGIWLGEWEHGSYDNFFSAQAGVYAGVKEGLQVQRNRGFPAEDADFAQLRRDYKQRGFGASTAWKTQQFIGWGLRGDKLPWRTWQPREHVIAINAGQKYPGGHDAERLELGYFAGEVPESEPFEPKARPVEDEFE